jgi:hypothetical protein
VYQVPATNDSLVAVRRFHGAPHAGGKGSKRGAKPPGQPGPEPDLPGYAREGEAERFRPFRGPREAMLLDLTELLHQLGRRLHPLLGLLGKQAHDE